ncbi:MAG: hypothetical protein HC802_10900 [Caldilineaceae bacterium]|nr:hypothetical protein [Caldilineaceae bacterium]
MIAAWPQTTCPLLEFLVKWNAIHQFFLAYPVVPVNGVVTLSDRPGIGMELDDAKIDKRTELSF